jgi:SpoIID/LytB domain protein
MLQTKLGNQESISNYGFNLPSGFFVIDKDMSGGKIKGITLYGGGYGHGAGMSQNGVVSLERKQKNYKEILSTYYDKVVIDNYSDVLK